MALARSRVAPVASGRTRARVAGSFALAVALSTALFAAPAAADDDEAVAEAVAFVVGEQRSDGGFGAGEAGFPGFETPDAVLAIGAAAQTGPTWDPATARAAVDAVVTDGRSGLGYLDDYADGGVSPGVAARLAIVASELGLDPSAFDPDGDGATDLVATMLAGLQPDGSLGAGVLNDTLYAVIAHAAVGLPVPASTVDFVVGAQQANGSWDFSGDPSGSVADPDTTGLALRALAAAGFTVADAPVAAGLAFLAAAQIADGTWGESFAGESNPNSTALAALGIAATGFDPDVACWRDAVAAPTAGTPYASPLAALVDAQAADGHVVSPFDEFGVNTLATSQAVLALTDTVPVARAAPADCPDPTPPPVDPEDPVEPTGSRDTGVVGIAQPGVEAEPDDEITGVEGELPRTGGTAALALIGALLVVAGALVTIADRSRPAPGPRT